MSEQITIADGHGPEWSAAIADLADRAGAVLGRSSVKGCLSVVDLEPWRLLDAWWLRQHLEPLAGLSGRPVRYVPCVSSGGQPSGPLAPGWSVGAAPVELTWAARYGWPHSKATGQAWAPDGPVLILAGALPKRLAQELLLAHNGELHEWSGTPPGQWQPLDRARHACWVAESLGAYAKALPSAMLSLPTGYWRFLEQAIAWASRGCIVVARAEGWSSLAEIREHAHSADVHADSPPVNFHWLSQHLPRIHASAHTVRACRTDAVHLVASGLAGGQGTFAALCAPLAAAVRSPRSDRAHAVRLLAAGGHTEAALSLLQSSANDPALLRAAWVALAHAARSASPAAGADLGAWLERVMKNNPWIGEDGELLRGVGHVALACARLDLAQAALRALDEMGLASAGDLAALACCCEQLGHLEAALSTSDRALALGPGHQDALAARDRIAQRLAGMTGPWRVQHGPAESPLLLDPLCAGHAPMLLRQMRDPSIASMTALPALDPGDDGRAWIQARVHDGAVAYAIVHRQRGFVGYLDLRLWKSTAFLCYWIGPDFQGLGYCAPAVALACELALRNGVDVLLSSAYDDNARSLRVLRKCGFKTMDVRAIPPDSDRTFLMLPATPMDAETGRQRLIEFCDNTGSGLHFSPAASLPTETLRRCS